MSWNRSLVSAVKCLAIIIFICAGVEAAAAQTASGEVWKDNATGLTWAAKDNGAAVNWAQAGDYCKSLQTGGFSDWRLPTIDELEALYDRSSKKTFKAKGTIALTDSCTLSSSMNPSGEIWGFCFSYGGRTLSRASGHGSAGRALCVRKSE